MVLKLIVDIGNTLTKLALFEDDVLTDVRVTDQPDSRFFEDLVNHHPDIQATVLSAVRDYPAEIDSLLSRQGYYLKLSAATPLPFVNKYKTPETLGKDRIAIVAAAQHRFPEQNVLAIDAGTTVTYDFINSAGEYLGGSISPGLRMRFQALHNYTDKLPLIELKDDPVELTGDSTESAILSGVLNGMTEEIKGVIEQYRQKFDSLKIIFGGGDYKYFDKRLKNNIFASPNIVLQGLKVILDFNEEI